MFSGGSGANSSRLKSSLSTIQMELTDSIFKDSVGLPKIESIIGTYF